MAAKEVRKASDLRECHVCFDDMTNKTPKLLECKHSFCMPCLSRLALHRPSGLKVCCPNCKHDTFVQSGNLSDLPDNFSLLEYKAFLDEHCRYSYCYYCNMLDREIKAICQCMKCRRFMCEHCMEKHKETSIFSDHEFIFLIQENYKELCLKHGEAILYVCRACSPVRSLCDVCITLDVPCHGVKEYVDYTTALSQEDSKLRSDLDQNRHVDDIVSDLMGREQQEIQEFLDNALIIRRGIEEATKEITAQLEKSFDIKSLTAAADSIKQSRIKAEDILRNENRTIGDVSEALKQVKSAKAKFNEEKQKFKGFTFSPGLPARLRVENVSPTFREIFYHMLNGHPKLLSWVSFDNDDLWWRRSSGNKLRPSISGRVLYVSHSDIFEVSPNETWRKMHTVHRGIGSEDLSVDTYGNHLYISQHCGGWCGIFKRELVSDFTEPLPVHHFKYPSPLVKWDENEVYDLCILDDCNAVVAQSIYRSERLSFLSDWEFKDNKKTYDLENVRLTRVETEDQSGFIATYVVDKTIICYDNRGNVMQTINKDGHPVKQPVSTTVIKKGNILVACSETIKIVELTLKGDFVRDVLTEEDGLEHPTGVAYSPPYLWVADYTTNRGAELKCFGFDVAEGKYDA